MKRYRYISVYNHIKFRNKVLQDKLLYGKRRSYKHQMHLTPKVQDLGVIGRQ